MARHKRGQLGAQAMRTLLACFAQSGLAVAGFSRREGISPSSFYRWRAVLGYFRESIKANDGSIAPFSAARWAVLARIVW